MHMYASRHQNALSPLILFGIVLTGLILTACQTGENQTGENQTGQNQTGQHQATSDPAGQPSKEIPDNIADLENLNRFPSDAEPIYEISFEKTAKFSQASGDQIGRRITGVAVDEERVFIADSERAAVHLFTPLGEWLRSIGSRGDGSSEFGSINGIGVSDDQLFVLHSRHLLSIYNLETLEHLDDQNLDLDQHERQPYWLPWTRDRNLYYQPGQFFVRDDGNLLILFSDDGIGFDNLDVRTYEMSLYDPSEGQYLEHDLLTFDWSGQALIHGEINSILETGSSQMIMMNVPYKRSHRFDFNDGELVLGWTEDLALTIYNDEGAYQRAIYHPVPKIPFSLEDVRGYESEHAQQALRSDSEIPDTWPAFEDLQVADDSRIWISLFHEQPDLRNWMLLESSGELVARFTWPAERDLLQVSDGQVYVLERDEATGRRQVISYRFTLH